MYQNKGQKQELSHTKLSRVGGGAAGFRQEANDSSAQEGDEAEHGERVIAESGSRKLFEAVDFRAR